MKLNLIQFMAFAFMLGWVGTDVIGGASFDDRLCISVFLALMTGYLNDGHKIVWQRVLRMCCGKKLN